MSLPASGTFDELSADFPVAHHVAVEVEGGVQQLQDVGRDLEDLEAQVESVLFGVHYASYCLERKKNWLIHWIPG